ncbi:MAG: dephospho-CoA kinase [Bacteroidaceae bacterium]|nr:dephospho-CoA kinase [Bacteroidaceae bacterium]
MSRMIFNEAQLELLNVLADVKDEAELMALKHAISEFFARRADEEMEKLWASGDWNEQTLQELKTAHYRTPYQQ